MTGLRCRAEMVVAMRKRSMVWTKKRTMIAGE